MGMVLEGGEGGVLVALERGGGRGLVNIEHQWSGICLTHGDGIGGRGKWGVSCK